LVGSGSGFATWNPDPESIREESGTLAEGHDAGWGVQSSLRPLLPPRGPRLSLGPSG